MSVRRTDHEQQLARRLARKAAYRQGGLCYWCAALMTLDTVGNSGVCQPTTMTADHVTPVWAGGRTIAGNIVAACYACNNTRSSAETNQSRRGTRWSAGDDSPASPFELLRAMDMAWTRDGR